MTDLSEERNLTQGQLKAMIGTRGEHGTILPKGLIAPDHWEELGGDSQSKEKLEANDIVSPLKFTPPANFRTQEFKLDLQHTPERPQSRKASETPIDISNAIKGRKALVVLCKTFSKGLRRYAREDKNVSNRVKTAEQLLLVNDALGSTLLTSEEDFLPTLLEDYIETMALAYGESVIGLEPTDAALFERIIKRGRGLYAFYPEIAEISDPTNTRFISDSFPYTVASLSAELNDIVFSEEGQKHFSDKTRELVIVEQEALVPKDKDEEKTKLARLSGIVGAMRQEMSKWSGKAQGGIDRAASWLKSYEKVEKIWEAIKEFIGTTPS